MLNRHFDENEHASTDAMIVVDVSFVNCAAGSFFEHFRGGRKRIGVATDSLRE
jgi:hypothetical protein